MELAGGLPCPATMPTVEASVINFARILEERIFIPYLLFILLFIVNVEESQSINPTVGKGKMQEKRRENSKSEEGSQWEKGKNKIQKCTASWKGERAFMLFYFARSHRSD